MLLNALCIALDFVGEVVSAAQFGLMPAGYGRRR